MSLNGSERNLIMSKKLVLVHYVHEFCGYRSDCDYDGNAIFGDNLLEAQYVSKRKSKRILSRAAAAGGLEVCGDRTLALGKPEDPRYSTEREYLELMTPEDYLFGFGSLQGRSTEIKAILGKMASKDEARYDKAIQKLAEEYDPF